MLSESTHTHIKKIKIWCKATKNPYYTSEKVGVKVEKGRKQSFSNNLKHIVVQRKCFALSWTI